MNCFNFQKIHENVSKETAQQSRNSQRTFHSGHASRNLLIKLSFSSAMEYLINSRKRSRNSNTCSEWIMKSEIT